MKKKNDNTRVTVRLRKSPDSDTWRIYLEAYPVIQPGVKKPKREREYLNRSIHTPIWDPTQIARTDRKSVV